MSADRARRHDVIVIGAGPTGLMLANLLGREGLSVLLAERNPTTVQEPRAVSIDDESLRTIQAADLIDTVMTQVVPGYGSRYLTPGGRCFLAVMPSGRPYGHPRRNAFRQPILEAQLREGLSRFDNVETRFGWNLESFSQDGEKVEAIIDRGGEQVTLSGRFLVGCDGASSPVRKALGFALVGETLSERWLIVDLENSPAERDTIVYCDVARPCIALPGPDQTRRFEFKLFAHETDAQMVEPQVVQRLIGARGVAPGSRIVRNTVYTFHARVADHWRSDRVLLAGDAAHLTPPFAGQGMNSGIRDAQNLAWKLASVLRAELPVALLDTYEEERSPHVAGMIDLALTMGRIMGPPGRFRGWLTQTALGVAGLWPPLRAWFGEMKYKPRPHFATGFVIPSDNPLVGRLLPQPIVRKAAGAALPLDDVLPPGFVLVGVNVASSSLERTQKRMDFGAAIVGTFRLSSRQDLGAVEDGAWSVVTPDATLAAASGTILLVRPDRYVMAAITPDGPASEDSAVAAMFRPQAESASDQKSAGSDGTEPPSRLKRKTA